MSIILEALKKVTKEEPIDYTVVSDLRFSQTAKILFISLSTILAGSVLLFFLIKFTNATISQEKASSPVTAEGYVPPVTIQKPEIPQANIFKIKMPNPKLTLNGIIYGIGKPAAIIENKILEEGASIKGVTVEKIYSDKVELLNETSGETFTLRVD